MSEQEILEAIEEFSMRPLSDVQQSLVNFLSANVQDILEVFTS